MRSWRIPALVSVLVHGALALSLMLAKTPEPERAGKTRTETIEIRLTAPPAPPPAEIARVEPAPPGPAADAPAPKVERRPAGRVKRGAAPPVATGGDGPAVRPPAAGPGETPAPRDLSKLDLAPKLPVPSFEAQGSGVALPPPPKDPRRKSKAGGGFAVRDKTFRAEVDADGTVTFDDRGYDGKKGPFEFTIDVNDMIMGALGDDPYAYEKRKFLEATREERLAMARVACGQRLSESLANLPVRLERIWESGRAPADKRRILFELWDECAEDGAPELKRYGELARATILHFIREHLPKASAHAYSALELDALNERRYSKRRFDPYAEES